MANLVDIAFTSRNGHAASSDFPIDWIANTPINTEGGDEVVKVESNVSPALDRRPAAGIVVPDNAYKALMVLRCLFVITFASIAAPSLPLRAYDCSGPFGCNYIHSTLYQHPDKKGQSIWSNWCEDNKCMKSRKRLSDLPMYPGDPTNWDTWNDAVSSVDFAGGDAWLLYRDNNFEGPCVCLFIKPGSMRPSGQYVNLRDVGFDDRVSSYKVSQIPSGAEAPATRCRLVPLVPKTGRPVQLVPASQ